LDGGLRNSEWNSAKRFANLPNIPVVKVLNSGARNPALVHIRLTGGFEVRADPQCRSGKTRRVRPADADAGKAAIEEDAITKPNCRNSSKGVQGSDRQSAMSR
jgi:hypothetical protein